ncbi:MAG: hypothetical protein R3C53_04120 [Pirellulaceae bacterium]
MGRRERYIPLTDAELRRLEEEHVAKQKLVENRKALIAKTLRSQRKDSLVQVLIKLCDENIHARWLNQVTRRAWVICFVLQQHPLTASPVV